MRSKRRIRYEIRKAEHMFPSYLRSGTLCGRQSWAERPTLREALKLAYRLGRGAVVERIVKGRIVKVWYVIR
jgi:hypothetical protein